MADAWRELGGAREPFRFDEGRLKCSTGIRLSATTSLLVGVALEGYAERLDRRDAVELPFIVTVVDAYGGEEVIATANRLHIATAAFTASVIAHPNGRILMHHGARVVSEHPAREAIGGAKGVSEIRVGGEAGASV